MYDDTIHIPKFDQSKHIPSTPAPRSVDHIQTDVKDRFVGIMWINKDLSMTLDDYFIEYDHWEIYSENKSYSKRPYQAVYKGVIREYHNYLCILSNDQEEEYYVVAKKIRTELEILEPYCACINCSASCINPLK